MDIYTVKLRIEKEEDGSIELVDVSKIVKADSIKIKKKLHKNGKPVIDKASFTLFPEIESDEEGALDTQFFIDNVKKNTRVSIALGGTLIFAGRLKFDAKVKLMPFPSVEITAMCALSVLKDLDVELANNEPTGYIFIDEQTEIGYAEYVKYILKRIAPSVFVDRSDGTFNDDTLDIITDSTREKTYGFGCVKASGNVLKALEDFLIVMRCSLTADVTRVDKLVLKVDNISLPSATAIRFAPEIDPCDILSGASVSLDVSAKDGVEVKKLNASDFSSGTMTWQKRKTAVQEIEIYGQGDNNYADWTPVSFRYDPMEDKSELRIKKYAIDASYSNLKSFYTKIVVEFGNLGTKNDSMGADDTDSYLRLGASHAFRTNGNCGCQATFHLSMTDRETFKFKVSSMRDWEIDVVRATITVACSVFGMWQDQGTPYVKPSDAENTIKFNMPLSWPSSAWSTANHLLGLLINEQKTVSFESLSRYELGSLHRIKLISVGILEAEISAIRIIEIEESTDKGKVIYEYTAAIIGDMVIEEVEEPEETHTTLPLSHNLDDAIDYALTHVHHVPTEVANALGASAEYLDTAPDQELFTTVEVPSEEEGEPSAMFKDIGYGTISTISAGVVFSSSESTETEQALINAENGTSASRAIVATQYAADVFIHWGQRFIAQSNYKVYYDVQVTTPELYNFTRTNEEGEIERGLWFSPSPSSNLSEDITGEEYTARYKALEEAVLNGEGDNITHYDGRPLTYEVLKENNRQNYMRTIEHNFNDTHRYLEYVPETPTEATEGTESAAEATSEDIPEAEGESVAGLEGAVLLPSESENTVAQPKRWIYRVRAVAFGTYRPVRVRQLTEDELAAYDDAQRRAIESADGFDIHNQATWVTRTQIWGLSDWSSTLLPDTLPDGWWGASVPATCCVEVQPFHGGDIEAGTITAAQIKARSIEGYNISTNTIMAEHLQANAIEAVHINTGSITAGDIFGDQMASRNWEDSTAESGRLVRGEGSSFDLDNGVAHWKEVVYDRLARIDNVYMKELRTRHTKVGPRHGLEVYDFIEYYHFIDANLNVTLPANKKIVYHEIPLTNIAHSLSGSVVYETRFMGHLYGFTNGYRTLVYSHDQKAKVYANAGLVYSPPNDGDERTLDYVGHTNTKAIYIRVRARVAARHRNEIDNYVEGGNLTQGFFLIRFDNGHDLTQIHNNMISNVASDYAQLVYGSGPRPTLDMTTFLILPVEGPSPITVDFAIHLYSSAGGSVTRDYAQLKFDYIGISQLGFFS